jgi:hypothetical protein
MLAIIRAHASRKILIGYQKLVVIKPTINRTHFTAFSMVMLRTRVLPRNGNPKHFSPTV